MPIAIPAFVGAGGGVDELSQNVAQVLTADLKRSGLFAPIDPAAFIERVVPPSVDAELRQLAAAQRAGAGLRQRRPPPATAASWPSTACGTSSPGQYLAGKQFYRLARELAAPRPHHRRFRL